MCMHKEKEETDVCAEREWGGGTVKHRANAGGDKKCVREDE